jgi:hypothetical protein
VQGTCSLSLVHIPMIHVLLSVLAYGSL